MKPVLSKQTLRNVFEGKATPLQKTLVEQWLEDPENQELYFQWLEEWECDNLQFIPDAASAYTRSLQIQPSAGNAPDTYPLNRPKRLYRWVAAAVLFLAMIGVYSLRDRLYYERYTTKFGEIRTVTLPDSSRVTLNANTLLEVPRFDVNPKVREVRLTGEAEFSVKHTADHRRFIVRTPDQLEVQVLGTEFTVYSRAKGSKVFLNKGRVQVRSLANQASAPLVIAPGDLVEVSKQGNFQVHHHQSATVHTAWKENRFVFENTPLSEIASQLNEQFGVHIIVADSALAQRTIGGTFKAQNADELLPILSDMLNMTVNQREGQPKTYQLTSAP
ncbi:FecR family protein [Larkinella bovis]|uniref:FecR family protein n=1 Tax=Larkinella bovis TaxID=683041 RepID=A0ABW0IE57_9BACT